MRPPRTVGLSPKIIAPLASAFSAFAVAKITDGPTEALVVALIGALGLWLSPPGDVQVTPADIGSDFTAGLDTVIDDVDELADHDAIAEDLAPIAALELEELPPPQPAAQPQERSD